MALRFGKLIKAIPPGLALALALSVSGCATDRSIATAGAASVSAAGPIPRGQAGITLARTKYYGMAVAVDVEVNGAKFASIDDGAAFTGYVRPGPVALSVSCWSSPGRYTVHFNAEAGRRYTYHIVPRGEQIAAAVAGGMVGLAIDTVANSDTSGAFKLVEIPANQ